MTMYQSREANVLLNEYEKSRNNCCVYRRSVRILCLLCMAVVLAVACVPAMREHVHYYTVQWRRTGQPVWTEPEPDPITVISCYYNLPGYNDTNQLLPAYISPHLCTHINAAFARVVNKTIYMSNEQITALKKVVELKSVNPDLRVLVSVGGSGVSTGFSEMVVDHKSRKVFIKSVKYFLRNYTLDGIDLDWEFPGVHETVEEGGARERQHFSQLLREIRAEFIREKRPYLLTVAVAAPAIIANVAYDVDQLNKYVDYVNVMSYDYHSYTKFTPFTGLNSPLYRREMEQLYLATLNINYTVHMYLTKGLDKKRIVIGVPTYGHSFKLVNGDNNAVGSPAFGYGSLGNLGFVNFPDVCLFLKQFGSNVTLRYEESARVPYLFREQEWVSFDNPHSVGLKAKYIKENNLRGAMVYSLNADDYDGVCEGALGGGNKFPLSLSIKNAL